MHVEHHLDPFQFAYRAGRGVEDAAVTLLHLLYKHLEALTPTQDYYLLTFHSIQFNPSCLLTGLTIILN